MLHFLRFIPAAFLVVFALVIPARAQSSFDRELTQLKEQHDRAVSAALEPVEKRHQAMLELLLKRATQAGDLESALKVKEELTKSQAVLANGIVPEAKTATELIGTWTLNDTVTGDVGPREFQVGGKFSINGNPTGRWVIENGKLKMTYNNVLGDVFDLPIKNMKLTGVSKLKHPLTLTKAPPK